MKQLSQTISALLCLLMGQRDQILSRLSLNHMVLTDSKQKISRPGYHQPPIDFLEYPINRRLCIVTLLKVYNPKTETITKSQQLLVNFKTPYESKNLHNKSLAYEDNEKCWN